MSGQRQKNQPEQGELAFPAEGRSDAPKACKKGTETLMAERQTESLAETERLMEEVCELEMEKLQPFDISAATISRLRRISSPVKK